MREHDGGVGGQVDVRVVAGGRARLLERALPDPRDPDRPPGAARDLLLVPPEHLPRAEPDGAEPEEAHLQRFHRGNPFSRNICLMPRTACRVRFSFSIMAKRT